MIESVTMYTAICDGCGKSNDTAIDGIVAWTDPDDARLDAINDEWLEDGDKIYCPDCAEMDDNDQIILKTKD